MIDVRLSEVYLKLEAIDNQSINRDSKCNLKELHKESPAQGSVKTNDKHLKILNKPLLQHPSSPASEPTSTKKVLIPSKNDFILFSTFSEPNYRVQATQKNISWDKGYPIVIF